jgi:hypothetical protein
LELKKLGDADIVRMIISLLPQQRYESIITILRNLEDLSTMTLKIVIEKIAAFEMSQKMGQEEEPTSSKPYAFACDEHERMKGKKKAPSSRSSSEEEEEEYENDDQASTSSSEDEEIVLCVRKVMGKVTPTPMEEGNTEEDDPLGEDLVNYGASPEHLGMDVKCYYVLSRLHYYR